MKQLYVLLIIILSSCSQYPKDVEQALKLAGDNRPELEKVLKHYSQLPDDSLKYRAACFLIGYMPYHYSIHNPQLDSFKVFLYEKEVIPWSWNDFLDLNIPSGKTEVKHDLHYITAEYLIRNIDFSFKVWQESPWRESISFKKFCEEILPYRLNHEPLEYWKEEYYAAFHPIIESMDHNNRLDSICMKLLVDLMDQGWVWSSDFYTNGFGALILLHKRYGGCKEQAELITYILRSVGIPSGIDQMIQHPNQMHVAHYWNYTHTIEGNNFSFDFFDTHLAVNGRRKERKYGKVYRQCYALNKESLPVKYSKNYIPSGGLRNVLLRDVTFDYIPETHISLRLEPHDIFNNKDLAYLCIFNGARWIPVTWCKPEHGQVTFRDVEPDILYQVRLIDEKRDIAASKPFILLGNENAHFPEADTDNLQSMYLTRKYVLPLNWPDYVDRSVGGKFQGANKPDFSDLVTLHTIQKKADMSYENIKLDTHKYFKYVRYLSADGGFNNMAEVKFYSGGQQLHGEVIGTDSSAVEYPFCDKHSVFDDDPLSFFEASDENGAWVGLKFDKAYPIDAIRYIFRNDDNNIRPKDTYELLYNRSGQWLSAGMQTADTTFLQYENIPSSTLYWLRNHTRGKEERPFTYEEGQQVWW